MREVRTDPEVPERRLGADGGLVVGACGHVQISVLCAVAAVRVSPDVQDMVMGITPEIEPVVLQARG